MVTRVTSSTPCFAGALHCARQSWRSLVVNLRCVQEVQPRFHGTYVLILEDGSQVTAGRRYRERLRSMLPEKPDLSKARVAAVVGAVPAQQQH